MKKWSIDPQIKSANSGYQDQKVGIGNKSSLEIFQDTLETISYNKMLSDILWVKVRKKDVIIISTIFC